MVGLGLLFCLIRMLFLFVLLSVLWVFVVSWVDWCFYLWVCLDYVVSAFIVLFVLDDDVRLFEFVYGIYCWFYSLSGLTCVYGLGV